MAKAEKLLNTGILDLSKLLCIAKSAEAADYVSKKQCIKCDELVRNMATERDNMVGHSMEAGANKESIDPFIARSNEWLTAMATLKSKLEGGSF